MKKEPNAAQVAQFEEFWQLEREMRVRLNFREPYGVRVFGEREDIERILRERLLQEHTEEWRERGCQESFYPISSPSKPLEESPEIESDHQRDSGLTGFGGADSLLISFGEHDSRRDWNL
jgi:hypothetical protein